MFYFPLLRTKKGELEALRQLSPTSVDKLFPVLQIPPPDLDRQGLPVAPSEAYVSKVVTALKNTLAIGNPLTCYLDPAPARMPKTLLEVMLSAISGQGGKPNPVFHLTGSDDYAEAYHHYIGPPTQVILRIRESDMVATLPAAVQAAMSRYEISPAQVLVMLDAGDISGASAPVNLYASAMVMAVFQLTKLDVAGIIIASASLPASLATLAKWVPKQYERKELALFISVKTATQFDLHFGDYATGNVIDAPTPSRVGSPKVRYTLAGEYEVLKGQKTDRSPFTMDEQFQRISRHIVGHADYSGRGFSWGDDHLHTCSLPLGAKRGNATTWVTVNTSHHLEMVISMLPAM